MSGRLMSSTTRSSGIARPGRSASCAGGGLEHVEARRRGGRGWWRTGSARLSSTTRIEASRRVAIVAIRSAPHARRADGSRRQRQLQRDRDRERRALAELCSRPRRRRRAGPRACGSATGRGRCRAAASGSASRPGRSPGRARGRAPAAMPMPVSATANVTRSPSTSVAETRTSPSRRELQRVRDEVAQDLRELLVVGEDARDVAAVPRRSATRESVAGSA